ncbi:NADH:ubiquinone oxidoreductase subunit N, partial [Pseudomonas amygdali pv. mori str. 301020]
MDLTIQHFIALAPLLITSLTVVVVMLAIAWRRNHSQTFLLSVAGLNLALLSIYPALKVAPLVVTPLLHIDNFACLYMAIILASTLACVTMAHAYLGDGKAGYPGNREELYLLI